MSLQKIIQSEDDARKFGFDWPNQFMILDQIIDECRDIREEIDQGGNEEKTQEEIGDLLLASISLCVFSGFNVEETLEKTNNKFSERMRILKELAKSRGLENLHGQPIEHMISLWKEAKKKSSC